MPKIKYSQELKSQVLADYEKTKDAKTVSAKYGVPPKIIWQWKAIANKAPERDVEKEFKKLKNEVTRLEMENSLLREIVKKTAMVMPIS